MTAPAYPAMPAYPAPGGRLSKSALISLILGILGCIPFVTGILAVILGIVGFVKTGNPGVRGRWMAVVGTILGAISVLLWAIFGATMTAAIFAAIGMTEAPRAAGHEFLRALSAGNEAQIRALSVGFTDDDIKNFTEYVGAKGAYKDSTFSNVRRNNDDAFLEGTVTFEKGTSNVKMTLVRKSDGWKVDDLSMNDRD